MAPRDRDRARDDDDDDGKRTSRKKGSGGGGGVSLDDDDAMETGLFSSGPARIKESIFADYDYGGNSKPVPVWLLTFEREGENDYEQPYSLGKGWKVSKDGLELIPKMGQTGLPKSCNAIRHLVKPLKKALKDADIDLDLSSGDPRVIEGLEVVLRRVEQEKRNFSEGGGSRRREQKDDKDRSILEIEEVTGTSEGGSKKKKAKARDDEDERPKKRNKADEDDDERPAKKRAKGDEDDDDEKPKRGSKASKAAADDDDDPDEDTIKEEGIETLIEVLQDGPVEYDDLEGLVKKEVKGHKHAAAIVEWCVDTDNLELEKGWTYAKDKKSKLWMVELA